MQLILNDEEVLNYMATKHMIEELHIRIKNQEEALEQANSIIGTYNAVATTGREDTHPFNPDDIIWENPPLDNTIEYIDSGTNWSNAEKSMLKERIFKTSTYYGIERQFDTVRNLFPHRTEAAVKAMVYTLGGTVRNNNIQPKYKGSK